MFPEDQRDKHFKLAERFAHDQELPGQDDGPLKPKEVEKRSQTMDWDRRVAKEPPGYTWESTESADSWWTCVSAKPTVKACGLPLSRYAYMLSFDANPDYLLCETCATLTGAVVGCRNKREPPHPKPRKEVSAAFCGQAAFEKRLGKLLGPKPEVADIRNLRLTEGFPALMSSHPERREADAHTLDIALAQVKNCAAWEERLSAWRACECSARSEVGMYHGWGHDNWCPAKEVL